MEGRQAAGQKVTDLLGSAETSLSGAFVSSVDTGVVGLVENALRARAPGLTTTACM
jgi:hypothetical protein